MMRYRATLTKDQDIRLAVVDAWFLEVDEFIERLHTGQPIYKPLSPLWTRDSIEEFTPDEIWDPKRNDPPPANPGGPFAVA